VNANDLLVDFSRRLWKRRKLLLERCARIGEHRIQRFGTWTVRDEVWGFQHPKGLPVENGAGKLCVELGVQRRYPSADVGTRVRRMRLARFEEDASERDGTGDQKACRPDVTGRGLGW